LVETGLGNNQSGSGKMRAVNGQFVWGRKRLITRARRRLLTGM